MMEYLIVLTCCCVILLSLDPSPVREIADAIKQFFKAYSFAMSVAN